MSLCIRNIECLLELTQQHLGYVGTIPVALVLAHKPGYGIGFLFTHVNGDFGVVSVTERNAARNRFLCYSLAQCE